MTAKLSPLSRTSFGLVPMEALAPLRPIEPVSTDVDKDSLPSSLIATLVAAGPPVDADKVRRVRDAIAAGTYQIDPTAIAAAMIGQRDRSI